MNHESFGQFIQFLEDVHCDSAEFSGTALIVREPWSATTPHYIFRQLEDALPVRRIRFDTRMTFEELTLEMGATLVQSISVFLQVETEISEELKHLLHEVHFYRKLPLRDRDKEIVHRLPLPATAKLVTFAERHIVETGRTKAQPITALFSSVISV